MRRRGGVARAAVSPAEARLRYGWHGSSPRRTRDSCMAHPAREIARRKAQGPSGPELQLAAIKQWSAPSKHEAVVWLMQAVDATLGTAAYWPEGTGRHRPWSMICRGARGGRWAPASTIAHTTDAGAPPASCMSVSVLTMPPTHEPPAADDRRRPD
jgi:hypothetical protein